MKSHPFLRPAAGVSAPRDCGDQKAPCEHLGLGRVRPVPTARRYAQYPHRVVPQLAIAKLAQISAISPGFIWRYI